MADLGVSLEGVVEGQPNCLPASPMGVAEHVVARVRSEIRRRRARAPNPHRSTRTDIIGALPLYVGYPAPIPFAPRPLRFISTGESGEEETCAAYLDLLHKPGEEKACVAAIERALAGRQHPDWERLELAYMPGTSPMAGLLSGTAHEHQWAPELQAPCCIANLSGGIEEYLGRLSSNSRAQARRLLRAVDTAKLSFEVATEATVDEFYDQLVELHQARWAQVGQARVLCVAAIQPIPSVARTATRADEGSRACATDA